MAQETCAGCPQQLYTTGKPGKVQGRARVGIVVGPADRGQVLAPDGFAL